MRAAASEVGGCSVAVSGGGDGGGGGSLQQQRRSRSGDVFKLCQQFENASLLGQMFTSTPDVRELHSVAPLYFTKPSILKAHKKQPPPPQKQQQPKYDPEVHKPKFTYRPAEDADGGRSSRNVTFKGLTHMLNLMHSVSYAAGGLSIQSAHCN